MAGPPRIDAPDLATRLASGDVVVLDLRPLHEFNGWRSDGAARGGHVPGAVPLPNGWLDVLDDDALAAKLAAAGCDDPAEIVLYGNCGPFLERHGAELGSRVAWLDWREWSENGALPVAKLAHHERLVHPRWLERLLVGGDPEAAPRARHLLVHAGCDAHDAYAACHLPGAVYLDTGALEAPPEWNRRPADELAVALAQHGIADDTTVIVYGCDGEGDHYGGLAAARVALILSYAGVEDVRLLDGGYEAWAAAGLAVEAGVVDVVPVPDFGSAIPARAELIVDRDEALLILRAGATGALVSVRSREEHEGGASGYAFIERAGHIPGDVWFESGSGPRRSERLRSPDGTMRPYTEIAAAWDELGLDPGMRVAFYCGTGWRASEAWFAARLMGWERAAVYDGGWLEWSGDPGDPGVGASGF